MVLQAPRVDDQRIKADTPLFTPLVRGRSHFWCDRWFVQLVSRRITVSLQIAVHHGPLRGRKSHTYNSGGQAFNDIIQSYSGIEY